MARHELARQRRDPARRLRHRSLAQINRVAARSFTRTRGSLEKYGLRSGLSGFPRHLRRRATGSVGSSGRRSRAHLGKIPFCPSPAMCQKDAEGDGWDHTFEVRRARKREAKAARSGNCACSPRLRRVMLGSCCPRAGPHRVGVRAYGRLGLGLAAHRLRLAGLRRGSDRGPAPSSAIAFTAVAQPNRATEIVALFSGNCTR
jgi:hypothetical protein